MKIAKNVYTFPCVFIYFLYSLRNSFQKIIFIRIQKRKNILRKQQKIFFSSGTLLKIVFLYVLFLATSSSGDPFISSFLFFPNTCFCHVVVNIYFGRYFHSFLGSLREKIEVDTWSSLIIWHKSETFKLEFRYWKAA